MCLYLEKQILYTYMKNQYNKILETFFFEHQILLNNHIPAQDEQRLVNQRIKTKDVVYRRNTPKYTP